MEVFVDWRTLAENAKTEQDAPAIVVRQGGKKRRTHGVRFTGPAELVSLPRNEMREGLPRCWIETHAPVTLIER